MPAYGSGDYEHFYPRSPCGERPLIITVEAPGIQISIHALLAESDCSSPLMWPWSPLFLSTLSLRRATLATGYIPVSKGISIHALLAESDSHSNSACVTPWNFYPRSPCGERRWPATGAGQLAVFLSTLSLRRATANVGSYAAQIVISIHALLAESDLPTLAVMLRRS